MPVLQSHPHPELTRLLAQPQITRPALRYFGGKWLLANWICSYFPDHDCYVEPFGGAFSVGLQKQPAPTEIYSDLNGDVVTFFQVLQQQPDQLLSAISQSPRTAAEFQLCQQACNQPLEWARRYYLYCQLAFIGGGGRWSHGLSSSRLSASKTWNVDHLSAIADRVQTVQFLNTDALDCIQTYDSPRTLFYCDPPYPHSVRGSKDKRHQYPVTPRRQYRHEMTDDDHRQLAGVLNGIQGQALISSYDCPFYEELYPDWQRVERSTQTSARSQRVECLWLSPQLMERGKRCFLSIPPEQVRSSTVQQQIMQLEQERNHILKDGPIALKGTWIETCQVSNRKGWRQAMWKFSKPIFRSKRRHEDSEALCKTQYIGKVGSPQHQQALAAIFRRKQLAQIQNQMTCLTQGSP